MFIDGTQTILDLDGKPMMVDQSTDLDPDGRAVIADGQVRMKGGKPMTVGYLIVTVLMAQFEGEEKLPGPKKLDRFALAEKFHGAVMPVEIEPSQAALILDLAEKGLPILTYSRVSRIIKAAEASPAATPVKPTGKAKPTAQVEARA